MDHTSPLVSQYWSLTLGLSADGENEITTRLECLRRFLSERPAVDPNAWVLLALGTENRRYTMAMSTLAVSCMMQPVSSNEHVQVMTMLLEFGADIDYVPTDVSSHPAHTEEMIVHPTTPLQVAIIRNKPHGVRFLLQRGASLDLFQGWEPPRLFQPGGDEWWEDATVLYRTVLAAGGWRRFAREPRVALVVLKELCQRGRATPPEGVMTRMIALPNELFFHVSCFWQGNDRDTRLLPASVWTPYIADAFR